MAVVVVAGPTGGLGKLMMERLLTSGQWQQQEIRHLVAIDFFRNDEARKEYSAKTKFSSAENKQITVLHWDATSKESTVSLGEDLVRATGGRVDALLATTGMGYHGQLNNVSIAEHHKVLDRLMKVNAIGPSLLVQLCLKYMKPQSETKMPRPPAILILSSFSGVVGLPYRAAYCSSKFALNGFLEAAFAEFRFVRFIVPCPTSVSTNFRDNWKKDLNVKTSVEANKADMTPEGCVDAIWKVADYTKGPGFEYEVMPRLGAKTAMWMTRIPIGYGGNWRVMDWARARMLFGVSKL